MLLIAGMTNWVARLTHWVAGGNCCVAGIMIRATACRRTQLSREPILVRMTLTRLDALSLNSYEQGRNHRRFQRVVLDCAKDAPSWRMINWSSLLAADAAMRVNNYPRLLSRASWVNAYSTTFVRTAGLNGKTCRCGSSTTTTSTRSTRMTERRYTSSCANSSSSPTELQ